MLKKLLPIFIAATPMIAYAKTVANKPDQPKYSQAEPINTNFRNADLLWFEVNVSGQDSPITLMMALRALCPSNIRLVAGKNVNFNAPVTWHEGSTFDALDEIMDMADSHYSLPGNGSLVIEDGMYAGSTPNQVATIVKPNAVQAVIQKANAAPVTDAPKVIKDMNIKKVQELTRFAPTTQTVNVTLRSTKNDSGIIKYEEINEVKFARAEPVVKVEPVPVVTVKVDETLKVVIAPPKTEWTVSKGDKLSEALIKWGADAHVNLIFEASDYVVGGDVHFTGTFDDVLLQVLEGANRDAGVHIKAKDYQLGSNRTIRIINAS